MSSLPSAIQPSAKAPRSPVLTKRHVALIHFMVRGIDRPFPRWPDIKPHVPLDVNIAADVAGLRRRAARGLFTWPPFVTAYEQEIAALRKGEHARCIRKMMEIRDDAGNGNAADRKVQLAASQALIGEGGDRGTSVTVNLGTQITAGVVIRMPARDRTRPEQHAKTIEHDGSGK